MNQDRKYKLSFKIVGFEPTGDDNYYKDISRKSKKESELWFVNERDSIVAKDIIEYARLNPNEQILMFYGAFHLQNGFINKNLGFDDLSEKETMGHCLAYYLKKNFGDTSVITFSPNNYRYANSGSLFKNSILESKKNEEFIFKPQELTLPTYQDTVNDYIINIHEIKNPPILVNYICSRYVLEKTSEKINRVKNSLPGYKALNEYNGYLKYAKLLTGIDFSNDTEFNDWATHHIYDGTDWLYSNKLRDTLEGVFTRISLRTKDKNAINSIISLYGISLKVSDPDMQNFDEWKKNEFPEIIRHIKFTNSIGIYWIGYPDEKVKAKEYLKEFSGEDFQEPEKYLQWYRKKFFGVEY